MKSHMLDEILQQPDVISKILNCYVRDDSIRIDFPENVSQLRIIASGSSYHAASIMTYFFKSNTNLDVNCDYSSEFILKPNFRYDKNTFYIFISQSGETSDTLNALKKVKLRGIKSMAVTNNKNSSLWNEADYKMFLYAGEEESVASTKAFSAQVLCLYLILLKYIQLQNCIDISDKISELKSLPTTMGEFFESREIIATAAKFLCEFKNIVILGNRLYYPIALEGSLKIKETSYINVNAYPMGEFLHGHVAVLNNKSAIIALIDEDNINVNLKNLTKISKEYNPTIITVTNNHELDEFDFSLRLTQAPMINKVFNLIIFFQLLAYEIAFLLKRNIDKPKGLKKVVLE